MPPGPIPVPNLITNQVNTQYQLISAVADPFALQYLPLRRGGRVQNNAGIDFGYQGGAGVIAVDIPVGDGRMGAPPFVPGFATPPPFANNINNGGPLLSIPPIKSVEWWHLTIWANEVIRDAVTSPNITPEDQVRAARQVSMLKARVTYSELAGQARQIDIDIGTGIDLFIGPTTQLFSVEILVPNPASAPPQRPGAFTTSAAAALPSVDPPRFRLDSYVVASAWCVYGSVGRPETRFSQAAFATGAANPSQFFVDIPVPDNARRLQIFSTEDSGNPPAVWGFENPQPPPTGGTPAPLVATAMGSVSFVGAQTAIVEVPQNAKFIQVRGTDAPLRTYNAVFKGQQ